MKSLFLILAIIAISPNVNAQAIVWDPVVMSTLVIQHKDQQGELKKIRNNEIEISVAQKIITTKMTEIKALEEKMYNRLKEISAIVKDAKDIVYASTIAADIGKYQGLMIRYATENPLLLGVAYEAEAALIDRTSDLFTYIYTNAVLGGDINLLDNKQRLEIIQHVIRELRIMRGIAYGIARKMKMAARTGVLEYINPFHLNYPDLDTEIVTDILKDF